jgi:hypothetical protein
VMVSAPLTHNIAVEVIEAVKDRRLRRSGPIGTPDTSIGSDHLPLLANLSVP